MRLRLDLDQHPSRALPLIERPRLAHVFAFPSTVRVVVLLAPAGFGKSVAVRHALTGKSWIHYRVGRERTTLARFVRGFAEAVAVAAPGALASFARAWERAAQSGSPHTILARWFCEHVHDAAVDFVIDDVHEAACDAHIAAFIEELVQIRSDRRLVIAARVAGLLPIPLWMATGVMDRPVDDVTLRFDRQEARALANALGNPDVDAAEGLAAIVACPMAVAYTLAAGDLGNDQTVTAAESFGALADRIFARRSPRERQFLVSAALLPSLRADLLEGCGWSDWRTLFAGMANDAPFLWEIAPPGPPRFHDCVADYLTARMSEEEPSLRIALAHRAVVVLQSVRHYADALCAAVCHGLVADIDELLDTHGFAILESGRVAEIREALNVIDAGGISAGAVVTAIRGCIEARFGRFDTSEAWFRLGLERAADEQSRVTIALYYARELMRQFRDDAFEVLEPFADAVMLADSVLIDVRSSLAQAYMVADRGNDARLRMDQALAGLSDACPAALRARVLARAAFVALSSGEASRAHQYATLAAPAAIAQGLYDVATSAFTVLYSVAYEVHDDHGACLDYLARVRECGIKSGSVQVDMYTLVAMYELYSEAGDRQRLAELDRAISAVDINYASLAFLESFLPARALQAGWAGNFSYAQAILTPTADRQATPLRKALRWSEVALYAAAAGDRSQALSAAQCAAQCIAESAERTTHFAFATLHCAVAAWMLGDDAQARAWYDRGATEPMPHAQRVGAFRDAVRCLLDSSDSALSLSHRLPNILATLHERYFGGIALLIESLPLPRRNDAERSRAITVGARLAAHRLDALYVAAVTSPAAEERLFVWLRSAAESDVDGRSLAGILVHWTPPAQTDSARARALTIKIRALADSRSRAPAIVSSYGREEDVDARIDILFADLRTAAPLMAEHSQAVSAWCTRIAESLGLDRAETAYVTRSGLMHDVGKIRTPQSILDAPRRLEPFEWEIMRAHPAEGESIAAGVPCLTQFLPVIRGHHERLDGKGYPDGLRLGAIPLAARIVTVADCFNAMIGRRPYRSPMSPIDALAELDRHRRTQFDPDIVDTMVRIVMGRTPTSLALSAP